MRTRLILFVCVVQLGWALPSMAATISGLVTDSTGAPLPDARVVLRDVATGQEVQGQTGADGRYELTTPSTGTYLVLITRASFAEAARTVVLASADAAADVSVSLELGSLSSAVSVTAARAQREIRQIPLHVDSIGAAAIEQANPLSTGDALAMAPNVTQVGNGPFGVRPRMRGLDSTRMLVLVDGERLNTARQATDRTGAEVGLVPTDTISRIEIVNGGGTLLYGSDALAGTVNIVTNEPTFTPTTQWIYGANGYYSSNEDGRRGSVTIGATAPRYAFRIQSGAEDYGNYQAGKLDVEDTRPFFASGQIDQADTIDDNFGFAFNAFPDPFNAPYTRTDATVPNSQAKGSFVNATGLVRLGDNRRLRVRYQRRRVEDIGFPDFAAPYFFNATSLPHSNLDKVSARYEAQAITPWLANLSLTAYYQRVERLLKNTLPVQFPAPTAGAFFPISVMRLSIVSETEQRVWTPGVELQAVITPAPNHVVTTGATFYRDQSSDRRLTNTTTSMVGQVVLGARGPAPVVFPTPVPLGPPSIARPVRVPEAALRDIAFFAQDEWRVTPRVSVIGGLRGDFYDVSTDATAGYDVAPVVAGAVPAIDPSTLPDVNGESITRNSLTGDIGIVANVGGAVSPFVHYGRSYRHPNLEELLFAGPATAGSIAPNITVEPETGNNFDIGAKFAIGRVTGGAYAFLNQYLELHLPGVRGDHRRRTAGPGHQLRRRADPGDRTLARRAGGDPLRRPDAGRLGRVHARHHHRGRRSRWSRPRRHAGRQHHAGEGGGGGALHRAARPVVGGVRRPRADRRRPGGDGAARLAVPHRPGPAVARRLHRAARRLGREPQSASQPRRRDLRGREPDQRLLPGALPVRPFPRPFAHHRPLDRRLLGQGTGNREQGTGNREQGTGNREQGTGNRNASCVL